ncbi:MAG: DsbA family protein [Chloroflexota bacterium]
MQQENQTNENTSEEVFAVSREVVNTAIVGLVFMVAGVLLGLVVAGQGLTATQVRSIVQDEVANAIETSLSDTLVSVLSEAGSVDASTIRGIIQEELAASGPVAAGEDGGTDTVDTAQLEAIIENALAEADRERNFMIDDDPSRGPEDAPVVIVEFSDFLCSFCGRHYQQTLTPLLENYEGFVRYVYRDFPSVGGQNAVQSALASECAADQDMFWEYHNILFDNQSSLGVQSMDELRTLLLDYAQTLELDMDTFTECYDSDQHLADIIGDASDAQSIGARGTPAFLVNGRFISGAQPYEVFANIIESELRNQGIDFEAES